MRFFSSWSQVLGGLLGVSLVAASVAACGGEVDTHYGPPSGLQGKTTPLPSGGSGDSGNPPVTTGDSGTQNGICGGRGPVDGGACAVSWKTGIHAKFGAGAAWKCADANCHGSSGANAPLLKGSDADSHADYLALAAWTKIKATPYINPCSTDPTQSTFACNVSAATCGAGDLRMPVGTPLTAAEEADLKTWAACGSPEN
jgi:hypothetical protein